jgi:hypothetical protein
MARPESDRLVTTIAGSAARLTRRLACDLEISAPEVLRRGLGLLQLYVELKPNEFLAIVDETTGEAERIRPLWL